MLDSITSLISGEASLHTIGILLALVALETILSADNAVALAALVQSLETPQQQRQALNWGLAVALVLRISLLLTATWVIRFWQVELAGALYLIWLASKHFWQRTDSDADVEWSENRLCLNGWRQTIALIACTDLAFSLDSVTAAIALSNQTWLVLTGCLIGIVTLRCLAGLFIQLLAEFAYLQDAAYLTVLGVGIRLFCKALLPDYVPPEWMILLLMAGLFLWGFSKRVVPDVQEVLVSQRAIDR